MSRAERDSLPQAALEGVGAVGFLGCRGREALLDSEAGDHGGEGTGAVGGAVVGVDALDGDGEFFKESEGEEEKGDDAGSGFIREELYEGDEGTRWPRRTM